MDRPLNPLALEGLPEALREHPGAPVLVGVLEAAQRAGAVLMEQLEALDPSTIRSKSAERDLVTAADVASERVLVEALRRLCPDEAIEAEEEVQDARDDRPRWFVDPLDGTINFVHGLPAFCVSLGRFEGGRPSLAVVLAPRLGEVYCALRGAGTWLLDPRGAASGSWRRLSVRRSERIGEAILATGFPYRRNELANPNLENFCRVFPEVRGLRRFGSAALDLAWVAAGRLDAFWELHLSPHDVAGGALLVEEAGGRVTDLHGGQDWLRGGSILAAPPALHGDLLGRLEA